MSRELDKTYRPQGMEDRIYQKWIFNRVKSGS